MSEAATRKAKGLDEKQVIIISYANNIFSYANNIFVVYVFGKAKGLDD
jgi:hypothetical protein